MPRWGGPWLLWVRSSRTNGDWWHWRDACTCFADEAHAASQRHINKAIWYNATSASNAASGTVVEAANDDDVGAPWA
eukprot:4733614-Lingulodinium_polyedra.AAC.1